MGSLDLLLRSAYAPGPKRAELRIEVLHAVGKAGLCWDLRVDGASKLQGVHYSIRRMLTAVVFAMVRHGIGLSEVRLSWPTESSP